jgi:glycosyltransferase involved in cell wall biosynthesis
LDRSQLCIVIPCHNEAATIGGVVAGAAGRGQVLVVDDRSTDASRLIAQAAGGTVMAAEAPGYDGALETGLRAAHAGRYRFVVTLDADGEHDPAVVADFAAAFEAGAPLVCGIRPQPQRIAEYAVAWDGRRRFGIDDLLCGMKGYSRPVIEAWIASGRPLHVNMTPTVLWRQAGGAMAQVRVTGERRVGATRFGRALAANRAILRAYQAAVRA